MAERLPNRCRAVGCDLPGATATGFCRHCDAVLDAVQHLRRELLARRGEHLRRRHVAFLAGLSPGNRDALVAHMAAHGGAVEAALEDFLGELAEDGLGAGGALT